MVISMRGPNWILYEVEYRQGGMAPDTQVLKLNGRPEVIQLGPGGINIFASLEALDEGMEPIAFTVFTAQNESLTCGYCGITEGVSLYGDDFICSSPACKNRYQMDLFL